MLSLPQQTAQQSKTVSTASGTTKDAMYEVLEYEVLARRGNVRV